MKKMFLFALMCLISISSFAIETAKCVLQHGSSVKTYDASKIAEAIKDAIDGDFLYLTEGQFGDFTIDKNISVHGAGINTVVGRITIAIPNNPTITNTLLKGIKSNAIILETPMNGVKIEKCDFSSLKANATNENIQVTNCNITSIIQGSYYCNMNVNNCKIFKISTYDYRNTNYAYYNGHLSGECIYTNCNISNLSNSRYNETVEGIFINCIIAKSSFLQSGNYELNKCFFVNCLLREEYPINAYSQYTNCYFDDKLEINDECNYSTEELASKGYYSQQSNDVVGIYGGANPFTLDPYIPKVTSSSISLDNANKKLNVSIKVTAK